MDDVTVMPVRHKLDVDEYELMGRVGILGEDDRVELIDGEVIDMMPIGEGHVSVVNRLNRALVVACGERAIVISRCSAQGTISMLPGWPARPTCCC